MSYVIVEYRDGTGELLTATLQDDIVSCGGKWFPGWTIGPCFRDVFIADYLNSAINEGGELSGELSPDIDAGDSFPAFTWKLVK